MSSSFFDSHSIFLNRITAIIAFFFQAKLHPIFKIFYSTIIEWLSLIFVDYICIKYLGGKAYNTNGKS